MPGVFQLPGGAAMLAAAVVLAGAAGGACAAEAHFDHGSLDALLKRHVDEQGRVDYPGLKKDAAQLEGYLETVAKAPFDSMGRDEKLALLINAYNACTLRLVLDHDPLRSIMDIPAEKRWDDVRWNVGGHVWSLNQIEHEQIRRKFKEPRVHFALVCAAKGCPRLRNQAYDPARLEEQLEDQARYTHAHDRWFRLDPQAGVVYLTKLYDWYRADFEQAAGAMLEYAARYAPDLRRVLEEGRRPEIRWLEYDWSLNGRE